MRWPVILLFSVIAVYLFRHPLLRAMGDVLITEDPIAHADAVLVLGGGSVDRGEEAARLYAQGVSDRIICSGGNVPGDIEALGLDLTESDLSRRIVVRGGVPEDRVVSFRVGTSTLEEAMALRELSIRLGCDTVMIVSHSFHLRRIRGVFHDRFARQGITVLLHGAPSHSFQCDTWWRQEEGMMMVFNEYAKLAYYALKY